jgi:hypothetical protein
MDVSTSLKFCAIPALVHVWTAPLDARENMRNLTSGSNAIMCPALSTRRHDRWPGWGPRSRPKHGCGFASLCTKRALDRWFDRS